MANKCKYCRYLNKCSELCEYGSLMCQLNRSFPKIVNKSYEDLLEENEQLKTKLAEKRIESQNWKCISNDLEKCLKSVSDVLIDALDKLKKLKGEDK